MEYTRVVGVELADMLASINTRVLDQYTFSGDGLCQFIQDHQDCLEQLEDQLSNLIMMTNWSVMELQLTNKSYHWNLWRVEWLNGELLMRVTVLEGHQENPIEIPDTPPPILIPPPGGNILVEIVDGMDDEAVQAVVEDQAEAGVLQVTGVEART